MESKRLIEFLKIKSRADLLKEINSAEREIYFLENPLENPENNHKNGKYYSLISETIVVRKSDISNFPVIFSGIINNGQPFPNIFLIELMEEKHLKLSLLFDRELDALGFIKIFSWIIGFDPKKINDFPEMYVYLWEV